jgi:hypothetical protein
VSLFRRRRQREWLSIAEDPRTPYMVGRLLGANEMAVALLAREDNGTAQKVAEVLDAVSAFFMEDDAGAQLQRRALQPPSEADTEVRPP